MTVIAPTIERCIQICQSNLGEKTQIPKIYPEDWCARRGEDPSHRQQCAVSSQHDNKGWLVLGQLRAVYDGSVLTKGTPLPIQYRLIVVIAKPGDQFRQDTCEFFFIGLGDNCDSLHSVPV